MPAAIIGPVAGAVVGGVMNKGGGGGSQTASKEPWSEAAPWIKDNIKTGQDLQRYYQQNPFNSLQQTGYQNQFSDLDLFRNQMAPGLMNFANKLMGSNYQRASAGTEIGATNPYAAQAMMPAMLQKQAYQASQGGGQGGQGLLGQSGQSMQSTGPNGLPASWNGTGAVPLDGPVTQTSLLADPLYGRPTGASTPSGGLLSAPPGQSYGMLDFQQLNPHTAANGIPKPAPAEDPKTVRRFNRAAAQVDPYYTDTGA